MGGASAFVTKAFSIKTSPTEMESEANYRLVKAAEEGDLGQVKQLVCDGADGNAMNKYGETALMKAAVNGHLAVVRYLAEERRVDVNATDKCGWTTLMRAAENGHLEIVRYLVEECDTDVNAKKENGRTALMSAAIERHLDVVRYLTGERGADVNTTQKDGWTPLLMAAANGHGDVVQYLVEECGAQVNAASEDGETALMRAARDGHIDIVRYLVEKCEADVDAVDKGGWKALMSATTNGYLAIVQHLAEEPGVDVNATASDGRTAVMMAAWVGHLDIVRYLYEEHGADVNATDKEGWTALLRAADSGHLGIVRYLAEECDSDVNVSNNEAKSAIRIAADRGDLELIYILKPFLSHPQLLTLNTAASDPVDPLMLNKTLSTGIHPSEITLTQYVDAKNVGGEYLAKWLGANAVVKLYFPNAAYSSFEDEVRLWQKFRHPNVIKLYGTCEPGPGLHLFVCEYASGGSLKDYAKFTLNEKQRVWKHLHEAALGLTYLHERGIVHGDLRCDNILIGSDGLSKLSNFRLTGPKSCRVSSTVGSMRWQSPEVLSGKKPTSCASDVYSLGMCILEAITGEMPWVCESDWFVCNSAKGEWTPEVDGDALNFAPECPDIDARDLISRMCCHDPAKRISLQSIVSELGRLALKESSDHSLAKPKISHMYTLESYMHREIIELWSKVQQLLKDFDSPQFREVFSELTILYEHLQGSSHNIALLTRFHALLNVFCTEISMNAQQALDIQQSSAHTATNSIHVLHRRTQSLNAALGQSAGGEPKAGARWEEQRRELFVTRVIDADHLLDELKSNVEKTVLLMALNTETTEHRSKYTSEQLEVMKNAVEVITSRIDKDILSGLASEWFIPWYELIVDEGDFLGFDGCCSTFRAKWLDSEVMVKQMQALISEDSKAGYDYATFWHPLSLSSTVNASENTSNDLQTVHVDDENQKKTLEMFRRKLDTWFRLSHPHVVQLFGACYVGRPFFVCESTTNGTLIDYLRSYPDELWQKLHETALGVQYLHARGVIHADLKASNVMVGSDMKAKVTNFGLGTFNSNGDEKLKSTASHWVAPECFTDKSQLGFPSDVYSLGMCIVEAMRIVGSEECNLPWGNLDNAVVQVEANRGVMPSRPLICTDAQWELVAQMCALDPSKRIKISTVVDTLAKLAHMEDASIIAIPEPQVEKIFDDIPGVIIAARRTLSELCNGGSEYPMYVDIWDQLETTYNQIQAKVSSNECRQAFFSLVRDAENATGSLRTKPDTTTYLSSIEVTMQIYSLRRHLFELMEAYPDADDSATADERSM